MDNKLQVAFTEARYVLKHLTNDEKSKIPVNLRKFISENRDRSYKVDINNLSKRAYAILAVVHRKYLAENKEELEREYRERLKKEKLALNNKHNKTNFFER